MIGRTLRTYSSKSENKREKEDCVSNAVKLYNTLPSICFNDYNNITDEEKEKMGKKYNPNNYYRL